jgi:hypothetical protein
MTPITEKTGAQLREVRQALLKLHKILLEVERQNHERVAGRIENSYQFLQLVMQDKTFAWLRYLSELIVQIDELLDTEEGPSEDRARQLLEQARFLVTPAEDGDEFQKKYFTALQESPAVVLAHAEVVRVLGKKVTQLH